MVWPRALALAELTWSSKEARDWQSFQARLPDALRALDKLGVAYRIPHVEGLEGDRLTLENHIELRLTTAMRDAEIRYTIDGTDPTGTSPKYERPIRVAVSAQGTKVTARAFTKAGRSSAPRAATFTQTTYRPADRLTVVQQGLRYLYYEVNVRSTRAIDTIPPTREAFVPRVARRGDERAERFAIRLTGYLKVPDDALYEFALTSDDGSSMAVGDRIVVDNDGFHGDEERTGMIALRAGLHPVTVRYFQGTGGASLSLKYRRGENAWAAVPDSWFVQAALSGGR
jgi:hexosaminidase